MQIKSSSDTPIYLKLIESLDIFEIPNTSTKLEKEDIESVLSFGETVHNLTKFNTNVGKKIKSIRKKRLPKEFTKSDLIHNFYKKALSEISETAFKNINNKETVSKKDRMKVVNFFNIFVLPNFDSKKIEQCFINIQKHNTKKIDPKNLAEKKMQELTKDEYVGAIAKMNENLQKIKQAALKAKNDLATEKITNKRINLDEPKNKVSKPENCQPNKIAKNNLTKKVSDSTKSDNNLASNNSFKSNEKDLIKPKNNQSDKINDDKSVKEVSESDKQLNNENTKKTKSQKRILKKKLLKLKKGQADEESDNKPVKEVSDSIKSMNNQTGDKNNQNKSKNKSSKPNSNQPDKLEDNETAKKSSETAKSAIKQASEKASNKRKSHKDVGEPINKIPKSENNQLRKAENKKVQSPNEKIKEDKIEQMDVDEQEKIKIVENDKKLSEDTLAFLNDKLKGCLEDKTGSSNRNKSDVSKMFPKDEEIRNEVGDIGIKISKAIQTCEKTIKSRLTELKSKFKVIEDHKAKINNNKKVEQKKLFDEIIKKLCSFYFYEVKRENVSTINPSLFGENFTVLYDRLSKIIDNFVYEPLPMQTFKK